MNTALNMLHRKRDEIVKNAYFPADKRVHISHWDDIIDKEWTDSKRNKIKRFDTAAPNAKKRKAGTQDEPETKKPKTEPTSRAISSAIGGFKSSRAVPAIGDRGNSRGPTSSSFVGGSGSSRGVTPVPEMAKTPGTAVTPPPFKYGTGFGPASEQKVFVWRGVSRSYTPLPPY